jgi:hypothetical protein
VVAAVGAGDPIGALDTRWHDPTEQHATIGELARRARAGGTEDEIRRALEVLAGRSLRFGTSIPRG